MAMDPALASTHHRYRWILRFHFSLYSHYLKKKIKLGVKEQVKCSIKRLGINGQSQGFRRVLLHEFVIYTTLTCATLVSCVFADQLQ